MAPTEGMVHCRGCGKEIHHTATSCPHCGCVQAATGFTGGASGLMSGKGADAPGMSFGQAVSTCLRKYVVFEGRGVRSEYWYFYLFGILLSVLAAVFHLPGTWRDAISLALFLPSIAAAARRLHDMGRSGWNQLWALTGIGIIPVIYWLTRPSDPAPNRFGPAPNQPCLTDQAGRATQMGRAE